MNEDQAIETLKKSIDTAILDNKHTKAIDLQCSVIEMCGTDTLAYELEYLAILLLSEERIKESLVTGLQATNLFIDRNDFRNASRLFRTILEVAEQYQGRNSLVNTQFVNRLCRQRVMCLLLETKSDKAAYGLVDSLCVRFPHFKVSKECRSLKQFIECV